MSRRVDVAYDEIARTIVRADCHDMCSGHCVQEGTQVGVDDLVGRIEYAVDGGNGPPVEVPVEGYLDARDGAHAVDHLGVQPASLH